MFLPQYTAFLVIPTREVTFSLFLELDPKRILNSDAKKVKSLV